MKQLSGIIILAIFLASGITPALAIEEADYEVVQQEGNFEIRDYAPHVLAEMIVDGSFENAGRKAIKTLMRYISGGNQQGLEITMTAPVGLTPVEDKWAVSFMMPAKATLAALPEPEEALVGLREVPAHRVAAVSYSGRWSKESYTQHRAALEAWIKGKELEVAGAPKWARYDSPLTPWFLRRNEILIPIKKQKLTVQAIN